MSEKFEPDAPTLRRIALLVIRVGQDDRAIRPSMREISTLIDQLKNDVALGTPFAPSTITRLGSLIDSLSSKRAASSPRQVVENAVLAELRELAVILRQNAAPGH